MYDVVILGGGPAGCAAGRALALAGTGRVLIVEAGRHDRFRVGESIPPDSRELLDQLQVLDEFIAEGHEPCYGSCSSWGDDRLGYNDFILSPYGHGWHLNRLRFERFLAAKAQEAGAELRLGVRFTSTQPDPKEGFRLKLSTRDRPDEEIRTRFVIDATGVRAAFARLQGARTVSMETLNCRAALFKLDRNSEVSRLTWLEAAEYGWWYAARLPDDRLLIMAASDADIARSLNLSDLDSWLRHLRQTRHIAGLIASCQLERETFQGYAATSCRTDPAAGPGWVAIGDAASVCDPITSQGLHKALATALDAAEIVVRQRAENRSLTEDYAAAIEQRFEAYLQMRSTLYSAETRWPDAPFWRRRNGRRESQTEMKYRVIPESSKF